MSVDIPLRLNAREEKFVTEYPLCGFNATEAAIRAGYPPKHARQQGCRVLKKIRPLIEARQQAKQQEVQELVQASTQPPPAALRTVHAIASLEQSLQLATALAFYDVRKIYDEIGNAKSPKDLTRRQSLMVTGFDIEENFVGVGEKAIHVGYTKKVRLVDRAPYLNMLLKWHGAFGKKEPQKTADLSADISNWTAEDLETYKKLKAKLSPKVIDAK